MTYGLPEMDGLIAAALAEDLGVAAEEFMATGTFPTVLDHDVTGAATIPSDASFKGSIVARNAGVVCGLPVALRVWEMLAQTVGEGGGQDTVPLDAIPLVGEGSEVGPGTIVAEVGGPARLVLAGERTALNMLMVLSGIATEARRWHAEAAGELEVLDTRKTLPGLRALSKYAVRVGGAVNHREGLYDMFLIKDNHIDLAGGITKAVQAARAASEDMLVEVEADTLADAEEAARAGADIVMLDNMSDEETARAVAAVRRIADEAGRTILTEASGNITIERLPALKEAGVDRVSSSALTLASPLDFGLDGR